MAIFGRGIPIIKDGLDDRLNIGKLFTDGKIKKIRAWRHFWDWTWSPSQFEFINVDIDIIRIYWNSASDFP